MRPAITLLAALKVHINGGNKDTLLKSERQHGIFVVTYYKNISLTPQNLNCPIVM